MPEPGRPDAVALGVAAPRLTVRLGPVRRAGRGAMAPEELRAVGIYLNAGRRRGWRKRLALLLATPETTIAAWASRSPANARPVPGAVAVAMRLMADVVRQAAEGAGHREAAEALLARLGALCHTPVQTWQAAQQPAAAEPVRPAAEAGLIPPGRESILVEPPPRLPGG